MMDCGRLRIGTIDLRMSFSMQRSDHLGEQDRNSKEKETRRRRAPQYALYFLRCSNFAYFDAAMYNAIFGNLVAQVRTPCIWLVSGHLRMFLGCLDSADECCTTAGGIHVSDRAEALVVHEACQVC